MILLIPKRCRPESPRYQRWAVHWDYVGENRPCYNDTALYIGPLSPSPPCVIPTRPAKADPASSLSVGGYWTRWDLPVQVDSKDSKGGVALVGYQYVHDLVMMPCLSAQLMALHHSLYLLLNLQQPPYYAYTSIYLLHVLVEM